MLGVDIEALGSAAARQWGLGDDVLHMIRRLPTDAPVRKPDSDDELLRIVASAANEVVDALSCRRRRSPAALNDVVARYARTPAPDHARAARRATGRQGSAAQRRRAGALSGRPARRRSTQRRRRAPADDAELQREQHG